jgi:O-6-methylguanine DNA methyltransferase
MEIPYGHTSCYGDLAASLGKPGGSRAVGRANGENYVSIVVPCHRVIQADGGLRGYGGGLHRKRWLLDLEAGTEQLSLEDAGPGGV